MTDGQDIRRSCWETGSYLNKMCNVGRDYNLWVGIALDYLPDEILDQLKNRLLIVSATELDACRIPRTLATDREIIVLSERILRKLGGNVGHPRLRYFIFCVLHEIAHAFRSHKSPVGDNLTLEDAERQEEEADCLAYSWFNGHVMDSGNSHEGELTRDEIEKQKEHSRAMMKQEHEVGSKITQKATAQTELRAVPVFYRRQIAETIAEPLGAQPARVSRSRTTRLIQPAASVCRLRVGELAS